MRFASPEMLWLLLALPLLAGLSLLGLARRRKALRRFAGGEEYLERFTDEISRNLRSVKLLLLYVFLFAVIVTLARPQWGTRLEPITSRGADIVIVLDTSLSMATEDQAPSRLGQAKHAIAELLASFGGDRVALVTFAGQASLNCPLTVDHAAVRLFLDSTDVNVVPVPGTALASALDTGLDALRVGGHELDDRGRAIVLYSDGEDHVGGLDDVIARLRDNGVAVHAVGCGTARGGPIPLRDPTGMLTGYKKDREGKVVTTQVNEDVLENIALETGGRYYRATNSEVELEAIAQALSGLSHGEIGSELRTRYEERFQIPLLVALLVLIAETVLGDRRRRPKPNGDARRRVA